MPPSAPFSLQGHFVRLEPLTLAHVPDLLRAASGPRDTYTFTTVPADEPSTRAYVEAALTAQAAGSAFPFATIDVRGGSPGVVVGSTRFGSVERWPWPPGSLGQRPHDTPDAVEIGWTWLAPSAQRTPLNSEAKLLLLTHAFEVWEVHRVTLKTDARNQRSRAAIERLGARLDGILRAHMPAADGSREGSPALRDSAVYSIVRAEWPEVRARLERGLSEPRPR